MMTESSQTYSTAPSIGPPPLESSSNFNFDPAWTAPVERAAECQPVTGIDLDQLLGTVVDNRFEVRELVGEGEFSGVYKARHTLMNRVVALKTPKSQELSLLTLLARFKNESQMLGRLDHPNVVTILDCFLKQGQPFVVMNFVEGISLENKLIQHGPLPAARARQIFMQVCAGLEHVHEQGIVHRDLKPSNIILARGATAADDSLKVVIVDFGSAILKEETVNNGLMTGTPAYMSPEQWRGESTDERTDVYCLGITLYEALTGVLPFYSDDVEEMSELHLYEEPPPIGDARPDLANDRALHELISRAISKDPADRFQSIIEFWLALTHWEPVVSDLPA